MGTKRAFNEDLQEFIDHPKPPNYGNKSDSYTDNVHKHFRTDDTSENENVVTVPFLVHKEFNTTAPLPLVTGIGTDNSDSDSGSVPVFNPNLFSEYMEQNFSSQKLFFNDNLYSTLLNRPPRKAIPVGPYYQADVPEFNSNLAKTYKTNPSKMDLFVGFCVVGIRDSDGFGDSGGIRDSDGFGDSGGISDSDGITNSGSGHCGCLDGGSIRCVQQHVKEARVKVMGYFGSEKFAELGMVEMGEEVASKWSEEEERVFHEVVYSNAASILRNVLWKELLIAFPCKKMKEIVSYYFNVFILRRRAVQNRTMYLEIDSDDDEWRESYGGSFCDVEDDDFVVGGHEDGCEGGEGEGLV